MFETIKNLFLKIKDQITLVTANSISAAINVAFWIYLASILEKANYGELGYLLSIVGISSSFALIGLPTLIVVYGAKKENVFFPAYLLGSLSAIIASVSTFFITQNIAISFLVIGMVLFSLLEAEFNSRKSFTAYSINSILRKVLMVALVLSFYSIFGFEGILWGYVLSQIPGLYGIYRFIRSKRVSISVLKPKIGFLINNYFAGVTQTLLFTADKIIIGNLAGFVLLGSYQLAIQPIIMLQVIPSALMVYLLPKESEGTSSRKFKIYTIFTSVILSILVFIFVPNAIEWFLPNYNEVILPIQIGIFSIIPTTANMILNTEFVARGKTKIFLTGTVIQTVTFLSLILILGTGKLELVGIIIAFIISTIVQLLYLITKKHIFN